MNNRILLLLPPFYTPWTPPLGLSVLKSFLEQHSYSVRCFDFNTISKLWGVHHEYFAAVQTLEQISVNDGYSKLWEILNAHTLARANGANAETCATILETIIPMCGIKHDRRTVDKLLLIVERYFSRLNEVCDNLDLSSFSVVGTSTYTTSLASSLFLLQKIKRQNPQVTTLMGGGIFANDMALGSENLDMLIAAYPFIDHVILGEAEQLLLKFLRGEFTDKRVISIADMKGATLAMKDVPVPDFTDFNLKNYYHLSVEGSRSCPFQCQFCSETVQWGQYRKKPPQLFVQQILSLSRRFQSRSFYLADSLINPIVTDLANELLAQEANILYDAFMRAEKIAADPENTKAWARSGLQRVRLGMESGSSRVLTLMNKKISPPTMSEVLKALASAGIRTTTYWVLGFPGETEQDFQQTLDFIREHHRYIYELEAHPYFYIPYGQVASRLFRCRPLYPHTVTDVTKFKVWEVDNVAPSREEKYDRLHRLCELAGDLGLINIYTMQARYQAEDRWQLLYPHATEVYKGTRIPIQVDSREGTEQPFAPGHQPEANGDLSSQLTSLSPRQLALLSLRLKKSKRPLSAHPIVHHESGTEPFPLSFNQEGVWLSDQLEAGNTFSNIFAAIHITGPLKVSALEQSLNEIIRRHEVLRTRFIAMRGQPVQIVAPALTLTVPVFDLQACPDSQRAAEIEKLAQTEIQRRFDLEQAPLCRITVLRLGAEAHLLLIAMHHIISDGWSIRVLMQELQALYAAFTSSRASPLIELPFQYRDFVTWQRQALEGDLLETQLAYWKAQLRDLPAVLPWPTGHPRPAVRSGRGARQKLTIPRPVMLALLDLSRREQVTLFMTLMAAFQTLLYRFTGQEDMVLGSPVAGRTRCEWEGLIGLFVNLLVLRNDLSGNPSFRELLQRVRETTVEAYTHQEVPFELLVKELRPQRNPSYAPLFQVVFALQNASELQLKLPSLVLREIEVPNGTTPYDLLLDLEQTQAGLTGGLRYNTDLFDAALVQRLLEHFLILLKQITENPEQRLLEIPLDPERSRDPHKVTVRPSAGYRAGEGFAFDLD